MQHEKPNDPIRIAEVTRRFKERYGWYIRMRLLRKERQEDPEPRRKVNPHARTASAVSSGAFCLDFQDVAGTFMNQRPCQKGSWAQGKSAFRDFRDIAEGVSDFSEINKRNCSNGLPPSR